MSEQREQLPLLLRLYRKATSVLEPLLPLFLWVRRLKGLEDPERSGERRGLPSLHRPPGVMVWVHGASVGELLSVIPLVERLTQRGVGVLVTSGTRTSADLIRGRLPAGAFHQYIPLDAPTYVRRFLRHWKPSLALFAESELWPNFIFALKRADIPLALINARMSDRSFERWSRRLPLIGALLGRIPLVLAQSAEDTRRFTALGAPVVQTVGNIKHDCDAPTADERLVAQYSGIIAGRPVWIVSSTHPGEDEVFIETHRRLREHYPALLTIIAPRHPRRGGDIGQMALGAGIPAALRSAGRLPDRTIGIYVADTLGELGLFYRLAPLVFMAGSIVPVGGHNPIEAVKLGAAVLHGPHVHNFRDIYAALDARNGAVPVADSEALQAAVDNCLANPDRARAVARAGHEVVSEMGGAVNATLRVIDPFLAALKLEGH
ncbi:MAG: 3-deoxy-D-manno-octulosonic acid transferase [Methylobacteriaceae bacterium]|jgi:3-deoxy-D-manno-octulosonic-acid transferase|nr:3-deoxy-D-manno-octulosonic acid transferase [Methylobacteriaceae bacterium]